MNNQCCSFVPSQGGLDFSPSFLSLCLAAQRSVCGPAAQEGRVCTTSVMEERIRSGLCWGEEVLVGVGSVLMLPSFERVCAVWSALPHVLLFPPPPCPALPSPTYSSSLPFLCAVCFWERNGVKATALPENCRCRSRVHPVEDS